MVETGAARKPIVSKTRTKTVFLHLGPAKTGSSALQQFLQANEALLDQLGVSYPLPLRKRESANHSPLAWILVNKHVSRAIPDDGGTYIERQEEHIAELRQAIVTSKNAKIVLSSEELFDLNGDAIDELLGILEGTSVKAILYVRNLEAVARSVASQQVKWLRDDGVDYRLARICGFALGYLSLYAPGGGDRFNLWVRKIGRNNVVFRKYGARFFHGGTIYSDFLDALDVPASDCFEYPPNRDRVNPSLRFSETIHVKDILNRMGLSTDQGPIVRHLVGWEQEHPGTAFTLPDGGDEKVRHKAHRIHAHLLDTVLDSSFGECLDQTAPSTASTGSYRLDYSTFNAIVGYLSEQIQGFDREVMDAIVAALDLQYEKRLGAVQGSKFFRYRAADAVANALESALRSHPRVRRIAKRCVAFLVHRMT